LYATGSTRVPIHKEGFAVKYPKDVVLKNKKRVIIRPYEAGDEALLRKFYLSFSEKERWFVPFDMMRPDMQCTWSEEAGRECLYSIVALCGETIVAHTNLQVGGRGNYTSHVGRLLIKVLPEYRQQRLGAWMLLDLIKLAMEKDLRDLRVDLVMGIDDMAIEGLRRFDFFKSAVLEEYVMDPSGKRYDMVIMMKRLHRDFGDF
jgi:ribosomal protein S18 acetylase RimI-like enzyme